MFTSAARQPPRRAGLDAHDVQVMRCRPQQRVAQRLSIGIDGIACRPVDPAAAAPVVPDPIDQPVAQGRIDDPPEVGSIGRIRCP